MELPGNVWGQKSPGHSHFDAVLLQQLFQMKVVPVKCYCLLTPLHAATARCVTAAAPNLDF